jgi:hypothetical protein
VDHQSLKLDDLGNSTVRGRSPELYTNLVSLSPQVVCITTQPRSLKSSSPTHSRVNQTPATTPPMHEYQGTSPGRVRHLKALDRSGADWPKVSVPVASLSLCVELLMHAWYRGMRRGKQV